MLQPAMPGHLEESMPLRVHTTVHSCSVHERPKVLASLSLQSQHPQQKVGHPQARQRSKRPRRHLVAKMMTSGAG